MPAPDRMTALQLNVLEEAVELAADELGHLEAERAAEYLRLARLGNVKSWEASQRADVLFAPAIRSAQGAFEIAIAALHRASRGA